MPFGLDLFPQSMNLSSKQQQFSSHFLGNMIILRASTHQGHSQFRGKGRQCVAISTMAILESQKTTLGDWDPYQLDSLLQKGDELYMKIISK